MGVWVLMMIPALAGVVLAIFCRNRLVWWELIIPFVLSFLIILFGRWIAIESQIVDTEWWGGYTTEMRYYEDWDEYIHQTCSRTCCCDSKGENCSTEYYDCSYVDYHPEYWLAMTTLGNYGVSEDHYHRILQKWGVSPIFQDLNRNYHSNDGDLYYGAWTNDPTTLDPVSASKSYENRTQAALNVFHFDPPDTAEISHYRPYQYPEITDPYYQRTLLGYNDVVGEQQLAALNATLGRPLEVRVFVLVFRNQPREAGIVQERYWQGGNKNEMVITVGLNDANEVGWSHVFSWTDIQETKVNIRHFIESQHKFDLTTTTNFVSNELKARWKRKHFSDFDYLSIEPTPAQTIWLTLLTVLATIGVGIWIVKNEIE